METDNNLRQNRREIKRMDILKKIIKISLLFDENDCSGIEKGSEFSCPRLESS